MLHKPHTRLLLAVVFAALAVAGGCDKLRARDKLNKGVQSFKAGQFDNAVEHFKQAKELDPTLLNARLYLATAYVNQYIPGAPSPENLRMGQQAIEEFQQVLEKDPKNLPAIDGIGSILYSMAGGPPFDPKKMEESKSYHKKHIEISPNDPEPYYWIGVIDWSMAFRGNKDMREEFNRTAKKSVKDTDPMPPALAAKFQEKFGPVIDEGIKSLQQAMEHKTDYDDAMAYLNLLYRQKADTEPTLAAHDADTKLADELVDKVKAIKQKKMENAQPTS
jgi:tetratricopeptide (TPR) repeat protein